MAPCTTDAAAALLNAGDLSIRLLSANRIESTSCKDKEAKKKKYGTAETEDHGLHVGVAIELTLQCFHSHFSLSKKRTRDESTEKYRSCIEVPVTRANLKQVLRTVEGLLRQKNKTDFAREVRQRQARRPLFLASKALRRASLWPGRKRFSTIATAESHCREGTLAYAAHWFAVAVLLRGRQSTTLRRSMRENSRLADTRPSLIGTF